MKPLKALKGYLKNWDNILLTEEDDVIVARCLDLSVSSHSNNQNQALDSLAESIKDYINYAIKKEAFNNIIDPDEKRFWEIYRKLELQDEMITFHKMASLKKENIREVAYA